MAVLGEIGDRRAVPGILSAMEHNRRDVYFLREAIGALREIGDPRAVGTLLEIAEFSFAVAAADEAVARGDAAPEDFSSDVRWWLVDRGLAGVDFLGLGGDCLMAVSTLDPAKGMDVSARWLDGPSWYQRASAAIGLAAAAEADPSLGEKALQRIQQRRRVEEHALVRRVLDEFAAALKAEGESPPGPADGPARDSPAP